VHKHHVIIDCDTGQDDAINLFLALAAADELEVLGVTAVAGNVPLALTARNSRIACALAGRPDVPVYAGCAAPLEVPPVNAADVHGRTGIAGIAVFEPPTPLAAAHAVDFLLDTVTTAPPGSVTVLATGPLTNLATAMARDSRFARRLGRIVAMGGAHREGGNFSPSAEFNMRADPHAAARVLASGCPLTLLGLDVTHALLIDARRRARLATLDSRAARATLAMVNYQTHHGFARFGYARTPLHDTLTTAWLLRPGLFRTRRCHVAVETDSALTLGHTAVDFWRATGQRPNCDWVHGVDADAVFELLVEHLARLPA